MNEYEFTRALQDLLESVGCMDEEDRDQACLSDAEDFQDIDTRTFSDAGVLTMNEGLVVTLPGGTEFQITIVRSM